MAAFAVTPSDDLSPARWLTEEVTSFDGTVASLMPGGYPAYLRVFHRPDEGRPSPGLAQTWAAVAAACGTTMHPQAQWHAISRDQVDEVAADESSSGSTPLTGSLDPLTLPLLAARLAAHTTTAAVCHFALWEGVGAVPRSWDRHPRFRLPGRSCWLFPPAHLNTAVAHSVEFEIAGVGEQAAAPEGISTLTTTGPSGQRGDSVQWVRLAREESHLRSPTWWWPEDRAWVVHSETDLDSTLVAADLDLMRSLLADPDIECLRVSPGDSLLASGDSINDCWEPGTLRLDGPASPPPS